MTGNFKILAKALVVTWDGKVNLMFQQTILLETALHFYNFIT